MSLPTPVEIYVYGPNFFPLRALARALEKYQSLLSIVSTLLVLSLRMYPPIGWQNVGD